eukprot:Gb_09147 [translate_table: standard]
MQSSRLWIAAAMPNILLAPLLPAHLNTLTIATAAFIAEPRLNTSVQSHDPILVNSYNYTSLLRACDNMKSLSEGKEVHALVLINGLDENVFFATKLVRMYAICGRLADARLIFDKLPERNVFLWNAMIRGYARKGLSDETFSLYYQMLQTGIQPDKYTFACILKSCADLSNWQQGKDIHDHIIRCGIDVDAFVGSALVAMYAKCSSIEDARHVFDKIFQRDVVLWNAMIAGYAQNGLSNEALKLFWQMESSGMKPDSFSIASVLPSCAHLAALQQGKEIHDYIIRNGFESNAHVISALVAMYAKCGNIDYARRVFEKMSERDLTSWSAMIAGYTQAGHGDEALEVFRQMQVAGVKPDSVTICSVLPACADLATLQQGKEIHDYIIGCGFESDVVVCGALIDMYAKCGDVWTARQVFDKMSQRNVVSWNAMIAGYGVHGHDEEALALFYKMQQEGFKPDHITFVAVLCACSHAGLVDEGLQYLNSMSRDYSITPRMEHYVHMVNLLGCAGRLDDAHDFIKKMPLQPDAGIWGALLSACRIHCNIELGEHAAKQLFELEPENAAYYVMLSNIYALGGRWNDVMKTRTKMKERGLKKSPGCSWIEINNRIYTFLAGDRTHPQSEKIYAMLESLVGQMKKAGYRPDTTFVPHDVKEDEKEYILCGHSEKLAIAFGLMNTCPGTPILINKNLRVCGDCHSAIKFIAKFVGREIIVRDMNRFHHFKDGLCSCGDYW